MKNALSDSIKRTRELEELLVEMGAVVEGVRKEMRDKKQAQKQHAEAGFIEVVYF